MKIQVNKLTDKAVIPQELMDICAEYLELREQEDNLKKELENKKKDVLSVFAKYPTISSVDFEDLKQQVQKRSADKITYDEQKIFNDIMEKNSKHSLTIFPRKFDPSNITEEEATKAGLINKCITRDLDVEALTQLLATKELDLTRYVDEGMMKVTPGSTLARVGLDKLANM